MKSGGRIVNIGSNIFKAGNQMLTVYGASKGALTSMSVCMAEELGPKGITINVVSPGPIATDMSDTESPIYKKLERNAHIQRLGTAQEVCIRMVSEPVGELH